MSKASLESSSVVRCFFVLALTSLVLGLTSCKNIQEKGLLGGVFSPNSTSKTLKVVEVQPKNKSEPCKIVMVDLADKPLEAAAYNINWDGECLNGFGQGLGKTDFDWGAHDGFEIGFLEDGYSLGYVVGGVVGGQSVYIGQYVNKTEKYVRCTGTLINGALNGPESLNPYNPRSLCKVSDLKHGYDWTGVTQDYNTEYARALLAKYYSRNPNSGSAIGGGRIATGTGFYISRDGHILTNSHVVKGSQKLSILVDGQRFPAQLIDQDDSNDIALLKVEKMSKGLPLELRQKSKKGTKVAVLGYPNIGIQGNEQKATFGEVNANSGVQGDVRFVQISSPIQPGNSGSPTVNVKGAVIGLATSTLNQAVAIESSGTLAQNVNYAVKIAYALPLLLKNDVQYIEPSNTQELGNSELIEAISNSVVLVVSE